MTAASNNTLVFIDTCSLLESSWNVSRGNVSYNARKDKTFWQSSIPMLINYGEVILTKRNYDELVKLSSVEHDLKRPLLGERCRQVLNRLRPLIDNGSILIVGDANDPFADAILLSAAMKFRTQKNLLFVTQDRALATDLETVANFQSVRPRNSYELKVRRIDRMGNISDWNTREESKGKRLGVFNRFKLRAGIETQADNPEAASPVEWWRMK